MKDKVITESACDARAGRLAKSIFTTSLVNGILAIGFIISMAFWMAKQVDTQSNEASRRLLESALRAELDSVALSTRDYARRDLTYDLVTTRNDAELYRNVGTGATENPTFDFIYIIDPSGYPIYAYQKNGTGSDISVVDWSLLRAVQPWIVALPLGPYNTVSNYARVGDQLVTVSAGRIRPDNGNGRTQTDYPVMIAGKSLSAERLSAIGAQLLIADVILHHESEATHHHDQYIALKSADGQTIGHVGWDAPQPGGKLLGSAMPVILGISILTLLATLFIGRASAQQANALLQQKHIARTDPLTGLVNRTGLEALLISDDLSDAIDTGHIAVVYLDLNGFKQLNDRHGHDVGDRALQIVAERIKGAVRAQDHIIRLGGDEFACILTGQDSQETASYVVNRIVKATEPPIQIADIGYVMRPSIGVALGGSDVGWDQLLKNADRAMYKAKMAGDCLPVFYSENMMSKVVRTAA